MRLIASLLGLLPLAFALGGCDRQKSEQPQGAEMVEQKPGPPDFPTGRLDRSKAGTPAPAILFQDPAGEPASLADFEGRPLLVNLWATWCGPCVVEMPSLDALAEREKGIKVLTISQDLDGEEKVQKFFAEHRFRLLEPYIDLELAMMSMMRIDTLPTTILYDGEGREVWRMTGMADWTDARTARLLKEAAKAN